MGYSQTGKAADFESANFEGSSPSAPAILIEETMSHKAAHSHGRRRRKLGSKKRRAKKLAKKK